MENKIIQIWEDGTHETALYPTSVAEAIKWDSDVSLAQYITEHIEPFYCIDTNNIIETRTIAGGGSNDPNVTTLKYNFPVIVLLNGCVNNTEPNHGIPTLNDVPLTRSRLDYTQTPLIINLATNDEIKFRLGAGGRYYVFGIKRG